MLCCLIYVVKVFEILCGNRDKKYSQATVEVYIIHSSRERYFIILLKLDDVARNI